MIQPARILDTRNPTNLGLAGPSTSAVSQDLEVTGSIPTGTGTAIEEPAGATGVLLNVTPVGPEAGGFISIRPGDATGKPTTSNLNFDTGQTNPNSVQVEVPTTGADAGKIEITYDVFGRTGPATDVLVDGQITLFSTTTLGEDVTGEEMRCSITTGSTVEVPFLQRWESGGPNSGLDAPSSTRCPP